MTGPVALVVIGGSGRMGTAILETAAGDETVAVVRVVTRSKVLRPLPGDPACFLDVKSALRGCPDAVVVEVALPLDAGSRVRAAAAAGRPLVVGTTGLDPDGQAALAEASERVAVVVAPNFSPGVALLRRALGEVLRARGPVWDVGILERHHRQKQDAPSGTAKLLRAEMEAAGSEAAVVSLRQGGVVGEHRVFLSGAEEELVFTHRAFSRRAFARGAVLAARFAAAAPAGRYGMDEVLGLAPPAG